MSPVPYAPKLQYLCDDPLCCDNGCPDVTCHTCGEDWPCNDYRAAHTPAQIEAQLRWLDHLRFPNNPQMWKAEASMRAAEAQP